MESLEGYFDNIPAATVNNKSVLEELNVKKNQARRQQQGIGRNFEKNDQQDQES